MGRGTFLKSRARMRWMKPSIFKSRRLLHLAQKDPELEVPRQIKNNSSQQTSVLIDEKGLAHWVRLVSYIEGDPMGEYDHLGI